MSNHSLHSMGIPFPACSSLSPFLLKPVPEVLSMCFLSDKLRPFPFPFISPATRVSCHSDAVQPVITSPVVELGLEKYGKKQVISITPQIYEYVLANVREPPVLRELREETAGMRGSQMQVSPDQGQLLAILVQILGAVKCIELGVYTVEIKHALAIDTLKQLIQDGECCSYDFAFVDAEKRMYDEYYELLLQLVRFGGLIIFDNVLWQGKVSDPQVNDKKTISLRNFNRKILEDNRVSISMIPIGDGMTICRKREQG